MSVKYIQDQFQGHFYCKGQNLGRRLRQYYDEALSEFDLLLMPTLPIVASALPSATASHAEIIERSFETLGNTCPFDVTGSYS